MIFGPVLLVGRSDCGSALSDLMCIQCGIVDDCLFALRLRHVLLVFGARKVSDMQRPAILLSSCLVGRVSSR